MQKKIKGEAATSAMAKDFLEVYGARVHNLKNIDVKIPRNQLVVITGLSGSGKSSLAFDVIYAEGQRRYLETFSAYARNFLGNMERPDVDKVTGLSPVISIEQKTVIRNPRSTVGTITEIYDFLRLLFARASDAYSHVSGKRMEKLNDMQIIEIITNKYAGKRIIFLAPLVKGRKGHYKELFERIRKLGFLKVRVDGQLTDMTYGFKVDRYKTHDIEIVIDKLIVEDNPVTMKRMHDSAMLAMKHAKGALMVLNQDDNQVSYFSKALMDVESGISYQEPEPNTFSFNSAYGACPHCSGLGTVSQASIDSIIPNKNLSIKKGGIAPLGAYKPGWIFNQLEVIGKRHGFTLDTPLFELSDKALDVILYGTDEVVKMNIGETGITNTYALNFEGIINFITSQFNENPSPGIKNWAARFMNVIDCPACKGARLRPESLQFKIGEQTIADLSAMDLIELNNWMASINTRLDDKRQKIVKEIVREIQSRIRFLLNVGLEYLSLSRATGSLSGGESQRIRLATQIGSKLTNVLYILDEPSIGLHQRDNKRLIDSLKELRDIGNSVIVAEHDQDMIMQADYVIDMGPAAGLHGGEVTGLGTPAEFIKTDNLTAKYLRGELSIAVPSTRRKGNGKSICLTGATGHNLKQVDLVLPLGKLICVSGVSGSGKSSLINETLYPILSAKYNHTLAHPLPFEGIDGMEHIDKVIEMDQSPIGRTPRSNPATYIGVFSDIRDLYTQMPESKIRGYKPGRFSFNVKGGRCETCGGAGVQTIEMNFLPDVLVHCVDCNGKRYNRETLEVRYRGKSISDVLDMPISQAVEFFEALPHIRHKVSILNEVGLGYLTLGQPSTTLSGGEAQRIKLAAELTKKDTGNTLYILDEPTTGLHFDDIRVLMLILEKLVNRGNTVVVIEHNLDVIKMADHVIDMGPEGGRGGGYIIAEGSPEELVKMTKSYTAQYLKPFLT